MNFRSPVDFLKKLPSPDRVAEALGHRPEKILVVLDRGLRGLPWVKEWRRDFKHIYEVKGGESLKDLDQFAKHLHRISKLIEPVSPRSFCILAVGGGTVGDFAGFVASVLKRGVPVIQVPTTLLAALDSAHGGKTALNVRAVKNQVGTFYPPAAVLIAKKAFEDLPTSQITSAAGELAKMALLEGGEFFSLIKDTPLKTFEALWQFLPRAVEAKYKVVEQDPREENGLRQVLNFGHTFGHTLESQYELSHGAAVALGMVFALHWSFHRGYLKTEVLDESLHFLHENVGVPTPTEFVRKHRRMHRPALERWLGRDKKMVDSHHLQYIFLEDIGRPLRRAVTIESLLTEAQRQGWVSR